ncbi:uncharacterized protein C3orf20 homolog isoform X2 [Ptychodera flava]|uniref:uncharacterized protein C3orf20 homolog isoform X2 n=1 Tax=Ptychodera flava TaxID=63121 RepID=UPI003969CE10
MNSVCYFYEQTTLLKRLKRQKKTPDELPQSLRFAHLNPRIAAFLRQQERARARAAETGEGGDENTPRAYGEGGEGAEIINLRDLKGGLGRSDFFLPDIKDGSFSLPLLRATLFDSNSNDGEEFTQKHLYQEATFAAPMLLIQLARILYLFENEHLDLPRELVNLLLCGWKELIQEAQYTYREWQSQAYLEKAMNQQEAAELEKEKEKERESKEAEAGEDADSDKKKKKKKKGDEDDGDAKDGKNKVVDTKEGAPAILQYRRESRASLMSVSQKPKTRLERFKSMHRLDASESRTDGRKGSFRKGLGVDLMSVTTESPSEAATSREHREQPSFLQTINFTLSSKLAEDKGWIIHADEKDDLERQTVIEWARQRLQLAMKQSQEDLAKAKDLGSDKPLVNRYYGDAKREAMMKYTIKKTTSTKSGTAANRLIPPKVPINTESDSWQKFVTSLPDGTTTVYYPSGRMAICYSRSGEGKPGHYTLIYKDNPDMEMIGLFTPTGAGILYHDNGKARFLSTDKGGMMLEPDGHVAKRWEWPVPHQKLQVTIVIQLNEQMTFRCINHQQMQVLFASQKETTKLNIGSTYGATEPKTPEEWGCLVTGEEFQSKAAKEYSKPPPPKKKPEKDKKSLRFRSNKNKSKDNNLAELQKLLEIPEKHEYDIPASKDLARLQRKIKNLAEDWMEHYRIAVGISSPHLRTLSSVPKYRKHRNIQSAKSVPGTLPSTSDPNYRQQAGSPLPEAKLSIRAASAHPTAGFHNKRPFSTMSTASRSMSHASEKKNVRIEIDGVPTDISKSPTPVTLSVASGSMKSPRATSTTVERPTLTPYQKGCPVSLRAEMLGEVNQVCKCNRHKMPFISDLEYDTFITDYVPKQQLIVIAVVSTLHPEVNEESDAMLTKMYENKNKNRTRPCYESRHDRFRVLNYDMATAVELTEHYKPLLLRRHNAVPGMFLIYMAGKLMFADSIFNGYGTAKKDFRAQLLKTEQNFLAARYLPSDFRFTPSRGRSGPRSAWGGQIGGTGVDNRAKSGLPNEKESDSNLSRSSSSSASSLTSKDVLPSFRQVPQPRSDSAAEFLTVSLSHGSYLYKESLRHSAPPLQNRPRQTVDFRKMESVK